VLIREIRGFFNRLSRDFKTKIRKMKKILTAFATSSCEHRESRIEHFFRIKRAGSSHLWGALQMTEGGKQRTDDV